MFSQFIFKKRFDRKKAKVPRRMRIFVCAHLGTSIRLNEFNPTEHVARLPFPPAMFACLGGAPPHEASIWSQFLIFAAVMVLLYLFNPAAV